MNTYAHPTRPRLRRVTTTVTATMLTALAVAVLIALSVFGTADVADAAGSCTIEGARATTAASQAECDALVDLFTSTGGSDWADNSSWLIIVSVANCRIGTTPQSTPAGVVCVDSTGVAHPAMHSQTASDPCVWVGIACNASGVIGVNLTGNNLVGELPESLGDLTNLTEFKVAGNQLYGPVPPSLAAVGSLTTVSFADNRCLSADAATRAWLVALGDADSIGQGCGECAGLTVTVDLSLGQNGTPADDVILGTAANDVIDAGGGNDVVCAGDGADRIEGRAGDDIVYGGDGIDRINGGAGDDTIHGEGGSDRIKGGAGNDTVYGGSGADRIRGGSDDDALFGMGGQDRMYGDIGDDLLQGNSQSDILYGGPGDDILRGSKGKDLLWGEAGNDELYGGDNTDFLGGGVGFDLAHGQRGADGPYVRGVSGCEESEETRSCNAAPVND